MSKQSLERWFALLSSLLLGAGLGCFVCLLPSPLHALLLPDITPTLVLSGSIGCVLGGGGIWVLWWHNQRLLRHTARRRVLRTVPTTDCIPLVTRGEQKRVSCGPPGALIPVSHRLRRGSRAARVWHAWRVVKPEPVEESDAEKERGGPCHLCGGRASFSPLLRCVHCLHLFPEACCQWVRYGCGKGATLSVSCEHTPLCRACLEEILAAGTQTLVQHAFFGPVLVRKPGDDNDDE